MNIFWIVVAMPGTPSVQQSVLYVNCVRENGQELKVIFDKWYNIISATRKILGSPSRIIPIAHLTSLEKNGGYHLHLPDSKMPITHIAINPNTKIRFVRVADQKNSTLFPDGTTESDVITIVANATTIAKQNNRSLKQTSEGYVIECYTRGLLEFSSVFPVFFFENFTPHSSYTITKNFSISSEDVLTAAMSERAIISYKTYHEEKLDSMIIDLAPVFEQSTNVEKGILFQFNKNNAMELFDFYKQNHPDLF